MTVQCGVRVEFVPGCSVVLQGDRQAAAGSGPLVVGWFGRVLADIGDAQSLQQNLSTFSGHIRRIKQVGIGTVGDGRGLVWCCWGLSGGFQLERFFQRRFDWLNERLPE